MLTFPPLYCISQTEKINTYAPCPGCTFLQRVSTTFEHARCRGLSNMKFSPTLISFKSPESCDTKYACKRWHRHEFKLITLLLKSAKKASSYKLKKKIRSMNNPVTVSGENISFLPQLCTRKKSLWLYVSFPLQVPSGNGDFYLQLPIQSSVLLSLCHSEPSILDWCDSHPLAVCGLPSFLAHTLELDLLLPCLLTRLIKQGMKGQ